MTFELTQKLSEYIWINGEFLAWEDAKIHITTHSLHYGGSVFEGERAYNGEVFKLKEHTQRLIYSANAMGMEVEFTVDQIMVATMETLHKNNIRDGYVRPIIWRAPAGLKMFSKNINTNIAIIVASSKPDFKNNIRLVLAKFRKFSPLSIDVQAKSSVHYAVSFVSKQYAENSGYDDALMLDCDGFVAESSVSNIFFVTKDDIVVTPIADSFLNGITRQEIISLLAKKNINVQEVRIKTQDIFDYKDCFLTGTSIEIAGVREINLGEKTKFFTHTDFVQNLQKEYSLLVNK